MEVKEPSPRFFNRYGCKAKASVIRDRDAMRTVLSGHVDNVSAGGFTLFLPVELALDEHLVVELENPIQRFKVRCRACVKYVHPLETGSSRMGCAVTHQIEARDLQMLRSNQLEAF